VTDILTYLAVFEDLLWHFLGIPALIFLGVYFTFKSRGYQFKMFLTAFREFFQFLSLHNRTHKGVHPLKAFFASLGGCVGLGNIVAVCTAVVIGGPGALFWLWITVLIGSIVKYSEIYLGVKERVLIGQDTYQGGPMYYLKKVKELKGISVVVALLLCVYGVEIFQFNVIVKNFTASFGLDPLIITLGLLALILYAGIGGVDRVGLISSVIMPVFIFLYLGLGIFILCIYAKDIPSMFALVFNSAFTGHAAIGGFLGSSFFMAFSQGVRRGCYTGDLGIGYASVIHSQTCIKKPQEQAMLAFVELFLDAIICTISVLMILLTGVWKEGIEPAYLVQAALEKHVGYVFYFMPLFIFLLGYSTIISYFCFGLECAHFLSPKKGKFIYTAIASLFFIISGYLDTAQAQSVMTIVGGLLLVINCYGFFRMRNSIEFIP
jgi:alanine or glycine:cation symporter, AGCS family